MKKHLRKALSLVLALALTLGCATPASLAAEEDAATVTAADSTYSVTVTADTAAAAGDTVSLTATVTVDGEEIMDLEEAGLYLWWWTDEWNYSDGNNDASYSNYDNNSGHSLTADVTLPSEGTYYIVAELQDSSYTDVATWVTTTITVTDSDSSGDEEEAGYSVSVSASAVTAEPGDTISLTATVKLDGEEITDLEAAG
ncbi:MAG: hypothetical protein LUF86_03520, partial [Clostridiales bacterium]|nr:hypothetical protein [Clostridiales bacterium]